MFCRILGFVDFIFGDNNVVEVLLLIIGVILSRIGLDWYSFVVFIWSSMGFCFFWVMHQKLIS